MNRLAHAGALWRLDVGAVLEERGVQGDERVVLELRVPREMLLEDFGLRSENLCERCDADAFRERPQVGEARRIPTVHEDELTGLQDPEREGVEVLGDHAAGPAEDRGLERDAEQGREVRVLPILVLLGGKAEGLKAPDRLPPDRAQPFGPAELSFRGSELRDVRLLRVDGRRHGRHRPHARAACRDLAVSSRIQPYPCFSRFRARSASPLFTIFPSTRPWTKSGTT